MTANEIVAELKKFGTAQTKKTWMTHGAQEPCLGVKVEDMKKIRKRVKMDYQLAHLFSRQSLHRFHPWCRSMTAIWPARTGFAAVQKGAA